jgi:hypothetical protein
MLFRHQDFTYIYKAQEITVRVWMNRLVSQIRSELLYFLRIERT